MSLTPMMQQYLDIKNQHKDALLMFRLGDFYEMFFEDAVTASKVLEITLTGRDAGSAGRIPMCGVPFHAAEQYIHRLIDKGFRVAICEQTEDPKQTKGLVKREVIRIVTPGTTLQDVQQGNRFLASLVQKRDRLGLSFVDIGTGDVWCEEYANLDPVQEMLLLWQPVEILVYEGGLDQTDWVDTVQRQIQTTVTHRKTARNQEKEAEAAVLAQYGVSSLVPLDLASSPAAVEAIGMALRYIRETQMQVLAHLRQPKNLGSENYLVLDYTAKRNLEIIETQRGRNRKGSLYGLLDVTRTSMGSRLLRRWLERPLQQVDVISRRLDAVEELVNQLFVREQLMELCDRVYDLDRLIGKLSYGSANPKDVLLLGQSLGIADDLSALGESVQSPLLTELLQGIPDVRGFVEEIRNLLVDEPPTTLRDGGFIRDGADSELDQLRRIKASGKEWLAQLEQREREKTGIKTLKVGFNKVFGYYIEVSKSNVHLVPEEYERRQTLSTGERYVLPELKEQEASILNAEERTAEREIELFGALRTRILDELQTIQQVSAIIAQVDVLCAFAEVATTYRYIRPTVTAERGISITQGRHPMVDAAHSGRFVPNDAHLNADQELILITGPNMAGKSTYMRQTALIVLLAHCGCFVPAQEAKIGIVDRIFTRIGASDDLGGGQSTFMVEMVELAQILRQATPRSLVLLDEIGRGTSTYDGLSIAESVMEALQSPDLRPLTLFATHYHELTESVNALPSAANYSVAVEEEGHDIVFLRTVVNRPADKSYGIQVARLAGIPVPVIARAQALLAKRELSTSAPPVFSTPEEQPATTPSMDPLHAQAEAAATSAPTLFDRPLQELVEQLADQDVLNLTPMQAMNRLHELITQAKEVLQWGKFK